MTIEKKQYGKGVDIMCIKFWCAMIVTLASLSMSACGDNKAQSADSAPSPETFQAFNFTATVESISGTPPFSVAIGDRLQGKIVYQSNASDWNVSDINQGWFHDMPSPARIELKLNSFQYTSSVSEYYILIENDDASVAPVRDMFEIFSRSNDDSNLRSTLALGDFTASAFSSSTSNFLPQSLNLDDFSNNHMFITYSSHVAPWAIGLVPDTLTKTPTEGNR